MKKYILVIVALVFCSPQLYAKSWHFNSIHIKATVHPDGSMHVSESRSYHFNGKFSWADYHLSVPDQNVVDFKLSDNFGTYLESDNEEKGTYYKETVANQFYCKWFYQARNETRTFVLDYTISNVVTVYNDVAELYWKFIGESNPAWVDTVSIAIFLPQNDAPFSDVKAWAHGPLWGNVMLPHDHVLLTINDLTQNQYVEARVIFPPQWLSSGKIIRRLKAGEILAEEKAFAEQANRERQQAIMDEQKRADNNARAYDLAMPMGFCTIILFVFLYWRYGRGFQVNYTQKIDPNIPDDNHPALLSSFYFNKNVSGATLSTALFYLAQKGILLIEKDENSTKKWYDNAEPVIIKLDREKWLTQKSTIEDFENNLIEFLFDTLANGSDELNSKQMKKASRKMHKWFSKWQKMIEGHLKQQPYFESESIKGAIINASVALVIIVLSLIIIISLGPNGLYAFIPGVIIFPLSFSILRFTPETKLLKKKLTALRNYLKSFATSSYQPSLQHKISDYFLFSIALGLGKKYTGNILKDVSVDDQAILFPWFIYGAGGSPADFASTINSIVSATATSVSSAAGAGGGMAGGAGAGGGGAAGGAG
jgi:uncharacterized membrane protein